MTCASLSGTQKSTRDASSTWKVWFMSKLMVITVFLSPKSLIQTSIETLGWFNSATLLDALSKARIFASSQNSLPWMELTWLLHQMRLSTTGNIDHLTQSQSLLSKRKRRNQERRMHSILKNFQMLMEFMTLRTGFSQTLVVKIWFAVLLLVQMHSLLVEWVELLTSTPFHIFNLIINYSWDVDHNKCTWTVIQLDSQSLISTEFSHSLIWMLRVELKVWEWAKVSTLLTKEKRFGL